MGQTRIALRGGWSLDLRRGRVETPSGIRSLSARELGLLSSLVAAGGGAVGRDKLQRAIDGDSPRVVDFTVRRLRAKIEPEPSTPRSLLTVWGQGYRLITGPGPVLDRLDGSVESGTLSLGDRRVDLVTGEVSGSDEALTAQEQTALAVLYRRRGGLVGRDELARALWRGEHTAGLDRVIHRLRQKLEPDPTQPRFLQTVRGRGYRLIDGGRPSNLPRPLQPMVGREGLLRSLDEARDTASMVVLVGEAGVGKTRTALAHARGLRPRLADRIWFVDASSERTGAGLLRGIEATLGLQVPQGPLHQAGRVLATSILRGGSCCLILDNLEQIEDSEPLIRGLASPGSGPDRCST